MKFVTAFPFAVTVFMLAAAIAPLSIARAAEPAPKTIKTVAAMPPVVDPNSLYSERSPLIQSSSFVVIDTSSENCFHWRENGR